MPAHPTSADWERLGSLLEQRRVELDPRYKNLALFAEERRVNYRLAWDIEAGRRTNYRRLTLRAIEVAYSLQPGAIDTALSGGRLAALNGQRHQRDDSPEGLIRRLDLGEPMDDADRAAIRKRLRELLEEGDERRANGGEGRRRA